jgi:hypothetical protein
MLKVITITTIFFSALLQTNKVTAQTEILAAIGNVTP